MKRSNNAFKTVLIVFTVCTLSGCYRQWSDVDTFAKLIRCDSTKATITKLAKDYQANVLIDPQSQSVQIQKEMDTVVIQFDRDEKITRVSVFKIELVFLGLHRRQLSPYIQLTCR